MEREDIKKLNRISLFCKCNAHFDVSAYKKFKKVISSKYAGDIWRLRYNSRP